MSEKTQLKRAARSTTRSIRIQLSQINADSEKAYCHRGAESLSKEALAPLVENLVTEGQATPLTVYAPGLVGADDREVYVLVGGFRRFHSLKKAITDNLDSANIHPAMEVDATEIVRGADQDEDDFHRDVLVRSVNENEQRKNLTNDEKLDVVKQFHTFRVPAPRAASALGMSETQFQRFLAIVAVDWLHALVRQHCIGTTDAAELAQKAEKYNRVEDLHRELNSWVAVKRKQLDAEQRELAKVGKKLSGAALHVKKYLGRGQVKHWLDCIEQGREFAGKPEFQFGIHFDKDKKTITVPGRVFRADELSSADFETMIAELQEASGHLVPLLRERQVVEAARDVSEDDKQRELARIAAAHRRKREEQDRADAGRPAGDSGRVEEPEPTDIDTRDEEPVGTGDGEGE